MKWRVYVDPETQEVRFLAPERPVHIGSGPPEEKARAFFVKYADGLQTTGKADELSLKTSQTDRHGGAHVRFEHRIPGSDVRALDVGTTAHFLGTGEVTWLELAFRGDLGTLDPKPTLSQEAAVAKAIDHVRGSCGAIRGDVETDTVELGARVTQPGASILVYRVGARLDGERGAMPDVVVDAKSGQVVALEERQRPIDTTVGGGRFALVGDKTDLKTISVTSAPDASGPRYQMISEAPVGRRVVTFDAKTAKILETRWISEWDASSTVRGAAVDAHFHVGKALSFLRGLGGGVDAKGNVVLSRDVQVFVHLESEGKPAHNAHATFFNGNDVITFGDGDVTVDPDVLPFAHLRAQVRARVGRAQRVVLRRDGRGRRALVLPGQAPPMQPGAGRRHRRDRVTRGTVRVGAAPRRGSAPRSSPRGCVRGRPAVKRAP